MASDGPARRVTTEDVLDVFRRRDDSSEPLTAPEIADALNCSRRTALDRLHDLADTGTVASKKVGGRSRVWWLPAEDESSATLPADDPLLTGDPLIAPEDPIDETDIDDVLYDEADG
jgi:predicted ArsR family transcriptional regulator